MVSERSVRADAGRQAMRGNAIRRAAGTAAATLLAVTSVPIGAVPAAAAPPAPTDVTIAWASEAHTAVAVTWRDAAPMANRVTFYWVHYGDVEELRTVPADAQDRVEVPASSLPDDALLRIEVAAVDGAGVASAPTASPHFDTDQPAVRFTTMAPRFDTSLELEWHPYLGDATPGDPLDLPVTPVQYSVYASTLRGDYDQLSGPSDETRFVVPPRDLPYSIGIVTTANEWGPQNPPGIRLLRTKLTTDIPARATAGRPVLVTGLAEHGARACDPGICWAEDQPAVGRAVTLEARPGTAGSWRTVARTITDRAGGFRFSVTAGAAGVWQYRVVAPNVPLVRDDGGAARTRVAFGTISRPVTTVVATAAGAGRDSPAQREGRAQRSAQEQQEQRARWARR